MATLALIIALLSPVTGESQPKLGVDLPVVVTGSP
jgi:hypothetical protein